MAIGSPSYSYDLLRINKQIEALRAERRDMQRDLREARGVARACWRRLFFFQRWRVWWGGQVPGWLKDDD
jgi:hypothetical protein